MKKALCVGLALSTMNVFAVSDGVNRENEKYAREFVQSLSDEMRKVSPEIIEENGPFNHLHQSACNIFDNSHQATQDWCFDCSKQFLVLFGSIQRRVNQHMLNMPSDRAGKDVFFKEMLTDLEKKYGEEVVAFYVKCADPLDKATQKDETEDLLTEDQMQAVFRHYGKKVESFMEDQVQKMEKTMREQREKKA